MTVVEFLIVPPLVNNILGGNGVGLVQYALMQDKNGTSAKKLCQYKCTILFYFRIHCGTCSTGNTNNNNIQQP